MWRKLFAFLMILMLLSTTYGCTSTDSSSTLTDVSTTPSDQGESIAQQLGVETHFEAEYVSDTGISVVKVNAEVVVPEAYTVNSYEAIPRAFTDAEVLAFIDRHPADIAWIDQSTRAAYDGHGPLPDPKSNADELGYKMYRLWIYDQDESNAERDRHSIIVYYGLNTRTRKLAVAPMLEYLRSHYNLFASDLLPLTDGRALGCSITLDEARVYADAEVQAICPDYALTAYGQMPAPNGDNSEMPAAGAGNPQYYIFRYTRHINGIPVNDDYGGESAGGEYDYTAGLGVISLIVDDEGVCYLSYNNPYDLGPLIKENVDLLPFDQIMDIFSKVGLLSIQYLEREADLKENTMDVYKIQFGYMAVRQPDNINAYYYVPVWDFYGHRVLWGTGGYAHGKDGRIIWGDSVLTINAINGTVIDRSLGY